MEGGSFDEATLKSNSEDLKRIQLKRLVLKDVSKIDMETNLFGDKLAFPLILPPVGFAGAYARRGEVQAARAAQKAGVKDILMIFKSELRIAMAHLGASNLKELNRDLLMNFPSIS